MISGQPPEREQRGGLLRRSPTSPQPGTAGHLRCGDGQRVRLPVDIQTIAGQLPTGGRLHVARLQPGHGRRSDAARLPRVATRRSGSPTSRRPRRRPTSTPPGTTRSCTSTRSSITRHCAIRTSSTLSALQGGPRFRRRARQTTCSSRRTCAPTVMTRPARTREQARRATSVNRGVPAAVRPDDHGIGGVQAERSAADHVRRGLARPTRARVAGRSPGRVG